MRTLDDALDLIPDIELDLTTCSDIAVHGLPPPVVVTLERRPDRWQSALRNLSAHGIHHVIKAPAVDGLTLSQPVLASLLLDPAAVERPLENYLQMTRPAVGCFLSHLVIWKRFLLSGAARILILEDDAVPARATPPDLARTLLTAMPADTDILLLGCTIMDGLAEPTGDPRFTRVYYYNGTYGYILTRKGCLNLLPRLLPITTHIDNQISLDLMSARDTLHVYCTEPRLFEHDFNVYSDVYVPVVDAAPADRALDAIFKQARARLLSDGARLFDMHTP